MVVGRTGGQDNLNTQTYTSLLALLQISLAVSLFRLLHLAMPQFPHLSNVGANPCLSLSYVIDKINGTAVTSSGHRAVTPSSGTIRGFPTRPCRAGVVLDCFYEVYKVEQLRTIPSLPGCVIVSLVLGTKRGFRQQPGGAVSGMNQCRLGFLSVRWRPNPFVCQVCCFGQIP